MEVITSLTNNKIKNLSKLNQKKYRDEEGKFLVEGEHLVNEACKYGYLVEVIKTEDYECNLNIPMTNVSYEIIKKLSNTQTPQKIIGVVKKIKEKEIGNRVLILDGLQDPGNLGTIIRSSVAFNIDTIILGDDSVDLYNDKVIRSSEGMIFKINVIRKNVRNYILDLKHNDYKIYGTKVTGGSDLKKFSCASKFAFIVGNEGNGVKEDILELCDDYIYIPMNKDCESLNVGVATSIILYELGDK